MTVQWTEARLSTAARLYKLGVAPKAIAAEVDVPLSKLTWLIGYRKDLFEVKRRRPRADPEPLPAQELLLAIEDGKGDAGWVKSRRSGYEPGLAHMITEQLFGPAPEGNCQLVHLTARTCRWPVRGTGAGTWYCAADITPGAGYCDCHRARSNLGGGA